MPFTFSHPAAVLPLTFLPRRWFSLTGLVIGSMAPDFEYFIRMRVYSIYSHTWMGIVWFDLPLSMLLALLFHAIVRNSLIDHLPPIFRNRFIVFKSFQWIDYITGNFLIVLLSCLLGTMTHVVWDSFTHPHGYFVKAIGFFQENIKFLGFEVPVFKLLQHTSTIIGGLFVIYAVLRLPLENTSPKVSTQYTYWACCTITLLTVIGLRFWLGKESNFAGNIIVTAITGGLTGLILTPEILRVTSTGR